MYGILKNNVTLGKVCIEVTLMLNEKRVKHMVKLAFYETKQGTEDLKISSYFKRDYISFNILWSIIWLTLGYAVLLFLLALIFMEKVMENLTIASFLVIGGGIIGGYILLVVLYVIMARKFYKKKHFRAYHRVKLFDEELTKLEEMYEEEGTNE